MKNCTYRQIFPWKNCKKVEKYFLIGKKLYYFEYRNQLEIDFFILYNKKITTIEVKSADNTKSKSLNSIIENWGIEQGIRLSTKNIGESGKINIYGYIFIV